MKSFTFLIFVDPVCLLNAVFLWSSQFQMWRYLLPIHQVVPGYYGNVLFSNLCVQDVRYTNICGDKGQLHKREHISSLMFAFIMSSSRYNYISSSWEMGLEAEARAHCKRISMKANLDIPPYLCLKMLLNGRT